VFLSDIIPVIHKATPRIVTLVLAMLVSGAIVRYPQNGPLASGINQIISEDGLRTAFWGIYMQDVESGEILYSHNDANSFIPASNQKLFVSATALHVLGSTYRYRTTLYFDGAVRGDVLDGDLILRGSGDPTFGSAFARGGDPLRLWARSLAEIGVRRIEGRIIGDDNVFDDEPYAEGWDIDYVTNQSSRLLGVSTNGLAYNDNVVEVKIRASSAGRAPVIETSPAGYLEIKNNMTTRGRQRGIAVKTNRVLGGETVEFQGSIPRNYAGTVVMPVTNPTALAVRSFSHYLEQHDIEVNAEAVDVDDIPDLEYSRESPLFVYVSPPLTQILSFVNKESNNFYAEQVFRTFSYGGSARGGERRIKELLSSAGASTEAISIRDGSGLSRKNFVTPESMAKLLTYMYSHSERDAFLESLPRGGEPQSTLRHRLQNLPVFAKTGSLEYARALSGYTTTRSGQTVAFAVFANNYTAPSYRITQSIDRIVMELASAQ
jgi:D-alanyl-D-alanine carboxypeptidase/D-alanyl-D-alanine-endopeptidase (penicillin-binding protein 4)